MINHNRVKRTSGLRAKVLLFFFLVLVIALSIVGLFSYQTLKSTKLVHANHFAESKLNIVADELNGFMGQFSNDLAFFSNFYALDRYLYWSDLKVEDQTNHWSVVVADAYRSFMDSHPYYYQFRFLDNHGQETIKIRRNGKSVEIFAGKEALQNKSKETYFLDAMGINAKDYAISPLALRRVQGTVEVPLVPVMRVSKAVVANNGHTYGVVVGNVYGEHLLSMIPRVENDVDGQISYYLIAKNGEYLRHPNASKEWGKELGHQGSLVEDFPARYDYFSKLKQGIMDDGDSIFSFMRIYPNPNDLTKYWILVGEVDKAVAMSEVMQFIQIYVAMMLFVLLGVFFAIRFLIDRKIEPLVAVAAQLKSLGEGEFLDQKIEYAGEDEITVILDSCSSTINNLSGLAKQVDLVASGDYSVSVQPLSNQDILGNALLAMTESLRQSKAKDENQLWFSEGLSSLARELQGELSVEQLAQRSISVISRYVGAANGVFYAYDDRKETPLSLVGSYMLADLALLTTKLALGQGTIGQAALERKTSILTQDFSKGQLVHTGSGSIQPCCLMTLPLIYEDRVYGVIELSSLNHFTGSEQEYLVKATETIAAETYSSVQKSRISRLLRETEDTNARLESQQVLLHKQAESLQESNAQMEEQQQQLRQQAESLQQSNAQMEEQQQQLRQQAESLQESNAQMEEQQQQLTQQTELLSAQNERLVSSEENLKQQAAKLESSSQYKSEFLANMSHELRTPLNSIILLAKLIGRSPEENLSIENNERSEVIYNAGLELQRLINDILDLAKVESGKLELDISTFDSGEFITELAFYFEHQGKEKGLEIVFDDQLSGLITSDRHKLSQVIRNLLSNSLKFTEFGTITFELSLKQDDRLPLTLSVTDTGLGIDQDKQSMIFEAFQQADGSTSRQYGGTGLGLSISQRFIHLLGGVIEVQSQAGEGSQFIVKLPLLDSPEVEAHVRIASPISVASTNKPSSSSTGVSFSDDREHIDGSKPVILLIEDDQQFAHYIRQNNKNEGYQTLIAYTAKEGLELASEFKPQGILLDLGLPDRPGADVLKSLKTNPSTSQIPVYVLSGAAGQEILLDRGALGYLQKPASQETITLALKEIIGKSSKPANRVLVAEGGLVSAGIFETAFSGTKTDVLSTKDGEQLKQLIQDPGADLLVLPYQKGSFDEKYCSLVRTENPDLPIIVFSETEIDVSSLEVLQSCTPHIIINTPKAKERLLKDVKRFLGNLPKHKKNLERQEFTHREVQNESLKSKQVLVVDDDARNLFVMTSSLEQQGAKVLTALNGKKALDILEKERVDLILLDLMMPVMNGFETLAAIRDSPRLSKLPVVILSAKTMEEDQTKCFDLGANEYLSKPIDYDHLITVVCRWAGNQNEG